MESNTFKSVAFGGFDKQDVVRYIERTAQEHADELRRLQEENASLSVQLEEMTSKNEALAAQTAELQARDQEQTAALEQLRQKADALAAEAETLRAAAQQIQTLNEEVDSLRPDAEAYRQFRNRIGNIECEAQKRAAELEANTNASLQKLLAEFRGKYQHLTSTFDVTADHVNSELRKIEVNLSQLPRALDQIGVELAELENSLHKDASQK